MAPTTSRRRLAAVTGLAGVAALAVPAMASASATAPSLTAAQQRQIAAADQRTTGALVAQALTLKGGVDPKAGHSAGPVSRGGTYPTRKGTFLSTDTKFAGLIPTGHSAMVYSSSYVVESLGSGVQWGPTTGTPPSPTRGDDGPGDVLHAGRHCGRLGPR
ncbi:MAG: hypothetical protein IPH03_02400 [Tetrasphaera sp.]|nr:hypothetical protein [Tetrasphaera sp.]